MKVLTVVGARPQFVKAGAVSRIIRDFDDISEVMVHTGQHFDANMSEVFFQELQIPEPQYRLDIHGGGHGSMTGRMLAALEEVMLEETPDIVLIYGDTNSTLAGALSASKLNIPVAHVEAGLRSFNRRMPEEVNRVVADHLSSLLLCPTFAAVDNLTNEGVTNGVVHCGDVMYDATLFAAQQTALAGDIHMQLSLSDSEYNLATIHRAENTDDEAQLSAILQYLKEQAGEKRLVMPIHPRTKQAAEKYGLNFDGIVLCEPVGYIAMAGLIAKAQMVFTDSGGVQKEAYFHRTPCVTLREETEWVETIEAGWNRLWQEPTFKTRREIEEYGNGNAATKVVETLRELGL